MANVLLVHGAFHSSRCWELTVVELEARGHRALAVDLPIDDVAAGPTRYAEVAAEAARALEGPVVVVGHSLGGLVIPLLPELTDVEELVFLCGLLPSPGASLLDQLGQEPDMLLDMRAEAGPEPGTTAITSLDAAVEVFYHDCPGDLARLAFADLRPQGVAATLEPSPVKVWPPAVPCRYVLARDDRAVNPVWSRRAVPSRLGISPIEIEGSHSPFLARTTELVDTLFPDGV